MEYPTRLHQGAPCFCCRLADHLFEEKLINIGWLRFSARKCVKATYPNHRYKRPLLFCLTRKCYSFWADFWQTILGISWHILRGSVWSRQRIVNPLVKGSWLRSFYPNHWVLQGCFQGRFASGGQLAECWAWTRSPLQCAPMRYHLKLWANWILRGEWPYLAYM